MYSSKKTTSLFQVDGQKKDIGQVGRHGTEVAFPLLTQQLQVRFSQSSHLYLDTAEIYQ